MNAVQKSFFAGFLGCILFSSLASAGNHTISTTVEVSATAINRYLNTQYNAAGFPQTVPVTYNGTNYTLALTLPQIILTQGSAKIQMIFDVNTATTNVYHFEVDPSINIPSGQITLAQVQAFLTDLPTQLNSVSTIPQWVRDDVTTYYNSLGFTVYPTKLIDQVNSNWFAQRRINTVSPYFALGWQVSQDLLSLVVSTYLNSQLPAFFTALVGQSGDDYICFMSNIQVTVKEALVVSGSTTLWHGYPNVTCAKGGTVNIDMGDIGIKFGDSPIVKSVFTIDNTWYCRECDNVPVNAVDSNGQQAWFGWTFSEN